MRPKEKKDQFDLLLYQIDVKWLIQKNLLKRDGLVKMLTNRILNRAMDAEREHHLGYPENSNTGRQ